MKRIRHHCKKKHLNVAMLGSFPPLRGISSYCYELATSVAGDGCQVEFISFKSMYPRFLYPGGDLEDDESFPTVSGNCLSVRRNLVWYNPVGWLLEGMKSKAALLHAQWWSLPLAPIYFCLCTLFKIRRKAVVFTVHNVLSHERSALFFYLSRFLFALGDHFIVHSELNRQQLIAYYGIPENAISLIPHGPLDFQVNACADKSSARAELGFSSDHKIVLLFGAIRPYKGIDTAIEAFALLKKQHPSARLLIAGKPWQCWDDYETMIKRHGIEENVVACLGYIPSAEVHRYFCAADLVILPYHHFDSQSGVGGTAVAFRKPLIVTRVGGLPDLVLENHAIIPPVDPSALADAITKCLNHPTRLMKMAEHADIVAQRLSWSGIAKRTRTVYESLIERIRLRLKPEPID
jgi:glycosyltransferase involved in cell wall biosynthesis